MKRKVLALLTAATVLMMGSMTAFAASPTTSTTPAPAAGQVASTGVDATASPAEYAAATQSATAGVTVSAASQATVDATKTEVTNLLTDVKSLGNALGSNALVKAAGDANSKVTAIVETVVTLTNDGATANADGSFTVKLKNSNITADNKSSVTMILHNDGNSTTVIKPSSVKNGEATFNTPGFSTFAVVKVSVTKLAGAPKTGEMIALGAIAAIVTGTAMIRASRKGRKEQA